jgi:hypothetical protein
MEILDIQALSFEYPDGKRALEDISFSLFPGEFALMCGSSGCGKTTLMRLLKRELAPHGHMTGQLLYCGRPMADMSDRQAAQEIGMVMQQPESQIITDRVYQELAFGLESMGIKQEELRLRVGETANYYGINTWFERSTDTLSGGQKQLLALASVTAVGPRLLLLDEPTAQLDPIAAASFIDTVYKLNREMGITVLIAEHRTEELFERADSVLLMEKGRLLKKDAPRAVCARFASAPAAQGFPAAARLFAALEKRSSGGFALNGSAADDSVSDCSAKDDALPERAENNIPMTVREGRAFMAELFDKAGLAQAANCAAQESCAPRKEEQALELKGAWFRYEKDSPDVLKGVNFSAAFGEVFSLLGGNGSGKSTLLKVIAGLERAYRGKIAVLGRNIKKWDASLCCGGVALLPQDVSGVFVKHTVKEDMEDLCRAQGIVPQPKIDELCAQMGIEDLLDREPMDLSGGERQKCALCKLLLTSPQLILLDEPTKGMDAAYRSGLVKTVRGLAQKGAAVIIATHDTGFAAAVSDRCGLFFNGELLSVCSPRRFFSATRFYTTAVSRITRDYLPCAVTVQQAVTESETLLARGTEKGSGQTP